MMRLLMALSSSERCTVTSPSLFCTSLCSLLMVIELTCDWGQIALIGMLRARVCVREREALSSSFSHLTRPMELGPSRHLLLFLRTFLSYSLQTTFLPITVLLCPSFAPSIAQVMALSCVFPPLASAGQLQNSHSAFTSHFYSSRGLWME